jgi:nucleotide-binding universal stress UspA family protein
MKGALMPAFKTILMPTDLSKRSLYALPVARSLAETLGAQLIVLFVKEPIDAAEISIETTAGEEHDRALRERLREMVPPGPGLAVDYLIDQGPAPDAILRIAHERPCDLIVMSTHGRSGLERLLMGSVAEAVVRAAACPVMTVRRPIKS